MAGVPDPIEVDLLKLLTGQATTIFTSTPYTPYLGLFTVAPSDSTPGTEAVGGGYARVVCAGAWAIPAGGACLNGADIALAKFTGVVSGGAPFVAFGLFTALAGGTLVVPGPLTDLTKSGGNNDQMSFPVGSLTVTVD